MIKNLLKKLISPRLKQDIKDELGVPSLSALLKQLKARGYRPAVVYDIGAYEGYWAKDFLQVYPGTVIYMFEAQEKKAGILRAVCEDMSNLNYEISLLGAVDGIKVNFEENETASNVNSNSSGSNNMRIVETLDSIIARKGYPCPDFLKLDVQGYELEVLKGGKKTLANAELCLLEVSLLDIGSNGTPLLNEVVSFMNAEGFLPYDISQFIRRPYDKALWQIDMLFVKKGSALIADKRWA